MSSPRPAKAHAPTAAPLPAPLPVGAEWRGGGEIVSVDEVPGGLQVKLKATIEVKGQEKPAMVAESLVRLFG